MEKTKSKGQNHQSAPRQCHCRRPSQGKGLKMQDADGGTGERD